MQRIVCAFGRAESSLQYLVRIWPMIVELILIFKRLRSFAAIIEGKDVPQWHGKPLHWPSIN